MKRGKHIIPASAYMLVGDGDTVKAGDALINGPLNPHDILHIRGKDDLQVYLVTRCNRVYQSQGVAIHDKHIEVILRQMLRGCKLSPPETRISSPVRWWTSTPSRTRTPRCWRRAVSRQQPTVLLGVPGLPF